MSDTTQHFLETYAGQLQRLNRATIENNGVWIQARLAPRGEPVSLDYQPGNGTAYHLVFVPVHGIDHIGPVLPSGCGDQWDGQATKDGFTVNWALVIKCNLTPSDFAYPFNLGIGETHFPHYVTEKTGLGFADACALVALFRQISMTEREIR